MLMFIELHCKSIQTSIEFSIMYTIKVSWEKISNEEIIKYAYMALYYIWLHNHYQEQITIRKTVWVKNSQWTDKYYYRTKK